MTTHYKKQHTNIFKIKLPYCGMSFTKFALEFYDITTSNMKKVNCENCIEKIQNMYKEYL